MLGPSGDARELRRSMTFDVDLPNGDGDAAIFEASGRADKENDAVFGDVQSTALNSTTLANGKEIQEVLGKDLLLSAIPHMTMSRAQRTEDASPDSEVRKQLYVDAPPSATKDGPDEKEVEFRRPAGRRFLCSSCFAGNDRICRLATNEEESEWAEEGCS